MGKRQSRRPTVSTVAGNSEPLLHVRDDANRLTWLVDGGASLTLVPPTPEERVKGPASTPLHAANGTPINCYGTRQMTLSLGSRLFDWEIVVADVATPLIGADFLMEYHLAADHTLGLLVDLDDLSTVAGKTLSATTCIQAGRHSLTYSSTPACLTPEPYCLSSPKSLPAPAFLHARRRSHSVFS